MRRPNAVGIVTGADVSRRAELLATVNAASDDGAVPQAPTDDGMNSLSDRIHTPMYRL